ncbi:MAG TPA: class I SAM-dependent methyltransferase [Gammaproteobacteria bacterium]|jgi:2-polyprenyl-3-methyl-5-hydroxy-6-metoxy-1,4-benzoquinol methylase
MNAPETAGLQGELDRFLASMPIEKLSGELALRCGMTEDDAKSFLMEYVNEMQITLDLVDGNIRTGSRILEVGAGLCLFSVFLKALGHDVVALEPSAGGFGTFETAKKVILESYADVCLTVWESTAQDLPARGERFDLIFSNNVLEHIPDLAGAWSGMCAALKPEGAMLHNCPNYLFPYEPHLGIPVLKPWPQLSALLFRGAVAKQKEVWESLNFVTYFQVKKLVRDSGMRVAFRKGLLLHALRRIGDDALFRERHSGSVVEIAYTSLDKLHLLGLLRFVPPMLATPMIFRCTRA